MLPQYFAYLTIALGLIGSFFYIKQTLLGKTKPNRVSWFFWMIAPFVAVYINWSSGVPIPFLVSTFVAGFVPLLVIIFSFFNKNSYWEITKFDILCGVLSAVSIIIWITTKNQTLSLIFSILADLFAGIPTLIKSWQYSESESMGPYSYGTINQFITFLIITNFSFVNIAFPIYLIILNSLIMLGINRKKFNI